MATKQLKKEKPTFNIIWQKYGTFGILIILLVMCINFVGDALRDALDPRGSL